MDNTTAVRLSFSVNSYTNINNYSVQDDAAVAADPLSQEEVYDERLTKRADFDFGLSYLKYRGYGRLQGYYGVGIHYYYNRTKNTYSYGNPMSEMNPTPSTAVPGAYSGTSRILFQDNGIDQSLTGGLIAGIEYFFLPKISIGGEVNLSYWHTWNSQSETEYEMWNGDEVYEYTDPINPGNVYRDLYTYQFDFVGSLYLMFHF